MRLLEFFRPFRVVGTRRVSEEEQVSVEVFARNRNTALEHLEMILASFRHHRKVTNEEVVRAAQQQLTALDSAIKNRTDQLADLDKEIERAKKHPMLKNVKASSASLPGNGQG